MRKPRSVGRAITGWDGIELGIASSATGATTGACAASREARRTVARLVGFASRAIRRGRSSARERRRSISLIEPAPRAASSCPVETNSAYAAASATASREGRRTVARLVDLASRALRGGGPARERRRDPAVIEPAPRAPSACPGDPQRSRGRAACGTRRSRLRVACAVACALAAACAGDPSGPVVIDLGAAIEGDGVGEVTRAFDVDGARAIELRLGDRPLVVEAWVDGGAFADVPDAQRAAGASDAWLAPQPIDGDRIVTITGDGTVTLAVSARGTPPPAADRDRALAWLDGALLDDPSVVSFAAVMAAIADDGHGGRLLARWFAAFAAGPGAGRAAFARFLDDVAARQGDDPARWDLGALPFAVSGVHDRLDLARLGPGGHCGELRVSVASIDPTFAPVHLMFLFRQVPEADDVTPDGFVHCRGTARRWARLAAIAPADWPAAARAWLAPRLVHDRFLLAESVELSLSPWQWRQWRPDGDGGLINPPLFQTLAAARLNVPGPDRDALLADVRANADAIAARTWEIPARYRDAVAEVAPGATAPLIDLSPLPDVLARYPELSRALGVVGCPRCHTEDAPFVQTSLVAGPEGLARVPSPFYDRELDARAALIDALDAGAWPAPVPFGPLQPL